MNIEENVQCSSSTSHQNIRLSLVPQASPHDLSASFSRRDLIIINNRCHPKHFNKKSEIAIIIVKKCLIKVPQNGQCPNLGWGFSSPPPAGSSACQFLRQQLQLRAETTKTFALLPLPRSISTGVQNKNTFKNHRGKNTT